MNIDKIHPLGKPTLSSTTKTGKDKGFKEIFEKKINPANPPGIQEVPSPKLDVLAQGDKVLNLLDDYARGLADPNKTLKDMAPLVESIQKEAGLMDAKMGNDAQGDRELTRLIKDLKVTAHVTVSKFHRGDYI